MSNKLKIFLFLVIVLISWMTGYSLREVADRNDFPSATSGTEETVLSIEMIDDLGSIIPFWGLSPTTDFVSLLDIVLDDVEREEGDGGLWHLQAMIYLEGDDPRGWMSLHLLIDRNNREIRGDFEYPIVYDVISSRFYVQDDEENYDADLDIRIHDFLALWTIIMNDRESLFHSDSLLHYEFYDERVERFSVGVSEDMVYTMESQLKFSWNDPQVWFYSTPVGFRSDLVQHRLTFYNGDERIADLILAFYRTQFPE